MAACRLIPVSDAFASGMIGYLDCQARVLGSLGYGALSTPGSTAYLLLSAMLTIFVAVVGIRMLLGHTPDIGDATIWFIKIGAAVTLATSWPAYQTLVYDIVLRAPAEIAAEIGTPADLPGASGGLPSRLDRLDLSFSTLARAGVGMRDFDPTRGSTTTPSPFPGFDTFALGIARILFLGGAIGSFALLRLSAGILLALGPLFAAFLLFGTTRGLFEGWARALIGVMLGSVIVALTLGIELALFEPWLQALINRRASGLDIIGTPAQLLAASMIFAVIISALLALSGRIAVGLHLPSSIRDRRGVGRSSRDREDVAATTPPVPSYPADSRSRAGRIGDSIAAMQRREETASSATNIAVAATPVYTRDDDSVRRPGQTLGLGQSYRRSMGNRISAAAGARDTK